MNKRDGAGAGGVSHFFTKYASGLLT
jgi:hypothetical protein